MRVLHLNAWERSGGAARAANRLHRGLRSIGIDSRMLVATKESDDPAVAQAECDPARRLDDVRWRAINWHWIAENRSDRTNTWFSSGRPGRSVADHPWVREADVLQLHWVPGFLASRDIAPLLGLGKPVVWTLHDEWAYTGGCHYAAGCEAWRTACRDCPQLARDPLGLVPAIFADKLGDFATGHLVVVAPSRWLTGRAAASAVFRGRPTETIPYGLELDVFEPTQRARGRAELGIDDGTLLLLFAASDTRERRKGYLELQAALRRCAGQPDLAERFRRRDVQAVVLGASDDTTLPITTIDRGVLHDDRAVAATVAAADLYVIPSLEDNLPNGVLEALACGTPVAGFATGGIPEAIEGGPLDLLAPTGDVGGLAEKIGHAIRCQPELAAARGELRSQAERRFGLARQAHDYLALYRRLLTSSERGTT